MKTKMYNTLLEKLYKSHNHEREVWAKGIVNNQIDLIFLSNLLLEKKEVASRFAWLLSDIIAYEPNYVKKHLPYLFKLRTKIKNIDFKFAFSTYWKNLGIPEINEDEAINYLFEWLNSNKTKVSIKYNALYSLYVLSEKYPEIKNELKISIENQLEINTVNFKSRALKILKKL